MGGYGRGSDGFRGGDDWRGPVGRGMRGYGRDFHRGRSGARGGRYGGDFDGPGIGRFGRGDPSRAPRRPAPSYDDLLRVSVRQNLFEDTWLDARNIQVDAEDGVVYLSGTVASHLESRYAWDDAWETEGVRGVVTHLEVSEAGEVDAGGDS